MDDVATVDVTFSIAASAPPSESDKLAIKDLIATELLLPSTGIKNFEVKARSQRRLDERVHQESASQKLLRTYIKAAGFSSDELRAFIAANPSAEEISDLIPESRVDLFLKVSRCSTLCVHNTPLHESHVEAHARLGLIFEEGLLGQPRDLERSMEHYYYAAANGHTKTQFNLGMFIIDGKYGTQNLTMARSWLREAALGGIPDALNNYGYLLLNGIGGPVDTAGGIANIKAGAEAGSKIGQLALSNMYSVGICENSKCYIEQDLEISTLWNHRYLQNDAKDGPR